MATHETSAMLRSALALATTKAIVSRPPFAVELIGHPKHVEAYGLIGIRHRRGRTTPSLS